MITLPADAVVEDVVLTHAVDAAFLWIQRERASTAPNYRQADLAKLDRRLAAHLTGLHQAGEAGMPAYMDSLGTEAGDAFVITSVAARLGPVRFAESVEALGDTPETVAGASSALRWLSISQALPLIEQWKSSEQAYLQCIAISAANAHRHDLGQVLGEAAASEDPRLRTLALQGAGQLARVDLQLHLQRAFRDPEPDCRYFAYWSALLLAMPNTAVGLIEMMRSQSALADQACRIGPRYLSVQAAVDLHRSMASHEQDGRAAVITAGATGDPSYIPWLLHAMTRPALARVGFEAVFSITGVGLDESHLHGEAPADLEEGPSAAEDSDVAIPDDEALPWPNVEAVTQWWQQEGSSQFQSGTPYLMGQQRNEAGLQQVLVAGTQRLRAIAAFELAHMGSGGNRVPLNVCDPIR